MFGFFKKSGYKKLSSVELDDQKVVTLEQKKLLQKLAELASTLYVSRHDVFQPENLKNKIVETSQRAVELKISQEEIDKIIPKKYFDEFLKKIDLSETGINRIK